MIRFLSVFIDVTTEDAEPVFEMHTSLAFAYKHLAYLICAEASRCNFLSAEDYEVLWEKSRYERIFLLWTGDWQPDEYITLVKKMQVL